MYHVSQFLENEISGSKPKPLKELMSWLDPTETVSQVNHHTDEFLYEALLCCLSLAFQQCLKEGKGWPGDFCSSEVVKEDTCDGALAVTPDLPRVNENSADGQIEPTHCLLKLYLAVDQHAIVLASQTVYVVSIKNWAPSSFFSLQKYLLHDPANSLQPEGQVLSSTAHTLSSHSPMGDRQRCF